MRIYVIYLYQGAGFPDKNPRSLTSRIWVKMYKIGSRAHGMHFFTCLQKRLFIAGVRTPAIFVIRKPPAVPGVQKSFSVEQKPPTW